ncbi:hypothetical protein QFC19_008597, partial [Naganishia cerealis]
MSYHGSGAERITERNPSGSLHTPSATQLPSQRTREDEERHLGVRHQTRDNVLREREAWAHDMAEPPLQKTEYRRVYDKADGLDHVRRQQELQIAAERQRERELYRLDRDPRERPTELRDAWYRLPTHDQPRAPSSRRIPSPLTATRQPSVDQSSVSNMPMMTRYDRERVEWDRERTRAFRDEEHMRISEARSRRMDEMEYQRSIAD